MSRDWCFTSFENELIFDKVNIRYICYGRERCPSTGREHLQGFAIFNRTCRIPKAKSWIGGGDGLHLEPRRGSRDQARDYCGKESELLEWGLYDPMTTVDLFRQPIPFLRENYPEFYCRYHSGLQKLIDKGPKWREVKVTVLWGKTGCGKTRKALDCESWFKLDPPYEWWDGYEGESRVIIDDYTVGSIPRGMFLNILDGYRLRLPIKGSHTYAKWDEVYITTNFDPAFWYDTVLRRCDEVTELG